MSSDSYGPFDNKTIQDSICDPKCGSSLNSYRSSVNQFCANNPQPFDGLPATYWADSALAVYGLLCLKDATTGAYCTGDQGSPLNVYGVTNTKATDELNSTFAAVSGDTDIASLPKDQICASCVYNVFKQIQSTPYSNYDPSLASSWASMQSICQTSAPTAVPTLQTNVTSPGQYAPPYQPVPCLTGSQYAVASGDNCVAIAHKLSVSTGSLIALNSLYQDCTNLNAGANLCIPPTCTTHTVLSGDTCDKIASQASSTFQQIVGWNPSIDTYCTNLIAGQDVCVSPPGGTPTLSTIAGATVTQTAVYAASTIAPPGTVPSGTTRHCGKWYQVQPGDFCQLIALNQTIDISLFEKINPSIDSACSNLLPGDYYCVKPTADWNITATSTIVTAPTTTPSGTTADCYE